MRISAIAILVALFLWPAAVFGQSPELTVAYNRFHGEAKRHHKFYRCKDGAIARDQQMIGQGKDPLTPCSGH